MFLLSRRFNVRAGMMLVPVGIINERHEPPIYYGVERPFVEQAVRAGFAALVIVSPTRHS